MRRTQPRNKGFNLVELVVAIGILSFGIYGAAELLSASRHTATEGSRRLEATALGNLKIQELTAARAALGQLLGATSSTQSISYPPDAPRIFEQNPAYAWQAQLQRDTAMPEKVNLAVAISASGPRSGEKPITEVRGFVIVPATAAASAEGSATQ